MATEHFNIDFILVEILVIVSIVSILVRRIKMPYTLGLILTGLGILVFNIQIGIELDPELILTLFLPALLFEGAMNIDVNVLKKNIKSITLLSLVGTFLTTIIIGFVLRLFIKMPLSISLLFASMIAPTDPIAVIGIFKELGVGKSLSVLIEGESLFNDGVAIVLFRIIIALIATGTLSVIDGISQFFRLFFGGLVLGFIIGYLVSRLVRKINDTLIQLTITTILAYGSYLLAESLHLSGVVATVTAGLVMGGYGLNFLSSSTKLSIASFWEYFGFLLNSIVFLLIGAKIDVGELIEFKWLIMIGFAIVIIARAISIYGISFFINKIDDAGFITGEDEIISSKSQHVLVWGGIHGGLSMVLLLSLDLHETPALEPHFGMLHALIFGVVFMSLLFQGSTMAFLLKKLGLGAKKDANIDYQRLISKLIMKTAAVEEIEDLYKSKIITRSIYREQKKYFTQEREKYELRISELLKEDNEIQIAQEHEVKKAVLIAKKHSLVESLKKGIITEKVFHEFKGEIDDKLVELSKNEH